MDALSGWKPGGGSTMEIRRSRSGVVRCALRLACLACLSVSLAPLPASAKSILVFGPHEDDEIFLAAGIARAARARGDTVKMVLVTNGDINGVSTGLARQGNSVTASQAIGLAESDLIFLGYGDGSLGAMYRAGSGSQVFTSSAGVTSTYGNRGLGGMDYHRYRYGVSGPYSRNTLLGDIQDVLVTFRPDEIYAPSYFDDHDDHMATALLLVEGILALQRAGVSLPVKLFQGIIWAPGAPSQWPQVEATGFTPWLPHYKPSCCLDSATPFEWERLRHVMVPPEMQTSDRATSLKWRAIQSGFGSYAWYSSWARREEIFWVTDFGANLASSAQVSVSSENSSGGYGRAKAVDGTLHGSQVGGVHEWATSGQLAGAWIQLDWPAPVSVAQVNLYDRPSLSENVFAGTLSFSDGSTIAVASLPKGGQVSPVTFPPKQVAWVRFTVNRAEGSSAGLSEIEVLGETGRGDRQHSAPPPRRARRRIRTLHSRGPVHHGPRVGARRRRGSPSLCLVDRGRHHLRRWPHGHPGCPERHGGRNRGVFGDGPGRRGGRNDELRLPQGHAGNGKRRWGKRRDRCVFRYSRICDRWGHGSRYHHRRQPCAIRRPGHRARQQQRGGGSGPRQRDSAPRRERNVLLGDHRNGDRRDLRHPHGHRRRGGANGSTPGDSGGRGERCEPRPRREDLRLQRVDSVPPGRREGGGRCRRWL